jgi:putative transposase
MKKGRFTEPQIVAVLKEVEAGLKVPEVCRTHGISTATFYTWRAKYGGLEVSELKRVKALEQELSQFKRMYADLALEHRALQDVLEKKR